MAVAIVITPLKGDIAISGSWNYGDGGLARGGEEMRNLIIE